MTDNLKHLWEATKKIIDDTEGSFDQGVRLDAIKTGIAIVRLEQEINDVEDAKKKARGMIDGIELLAQRMQQHAGQCQAGAQSQGSTEQQPEAPPRQEQPVTNEA